MGSFPETQIDPNCLFRLSFAHLGLHVQVVYLCSIVSLCDSVPFLKHQWFVKRMLTNKSLKNSMENNFILFTLGKKSSLEVKCRICQVVKLQNGLGQF